MHVIPEYNYNVDICHYKFSFNIFMIASFIITAMTHHLRFVIFIARPCVFQFNLSENQFVAKAGQYIGWYDEVIGGQGAIGYEDSDEEQACVLTGLHSKIEIGTEVNEVVSGGNRTHLLKNRQYSIEICYGELKQNKYY